MPAVETNRAGATSSGCNAAQLKASDYEEAIIGAGPGGPKSLLPSFRETGEASVLDLEVAAFDDRTKGGLPRVMVSCH